MRKWLFAPAAELRLLEHAAARAFVFWQAVEDVNRGVCRAGRRLYQLKALQDVRRAADYLALARSLPGYGAVAFPAARTDCRATPALAVHVGWPGLRLSAACEGPTQAPAQSADVPWAQVRSWRADDDAAALRLCYSRPDQPPRTITLFTPYVSVRRFTFLAITGNTTTDVKCPCLDEFLKSLKKTGTRFTRFEMLKLYDGKL